jgi:hypothetical protein
VQGSSTDREQLYNMICDSRFQRLFLSTTVKAVASTAASR